MIEHDDYELDARVAFATTGRRSARPGRTTPTARTPTGPRCA